MKQLFALLGSIVTLAVSLGAGSALAAGNSPLDGGAYNMLGDSTMATVPMVQDTLHANTSSVYGSYGNAGMYCAVFITLGFVSPGDCNGHA